MRQKLITLCPTTFELALKKRNFSEWVRESLKNEVQKNKDQWEREWSVGKCDCGVFKDRLAPAWCTNHEVHEVKE